VEVKITIDENGDVISAKAGRYPGDPALQLAAIQAAKGAKFTPTSVCGEPAKIYGRIVYEFGRNQ
jgi:TonB family protein